MSNVYLHLLISHIPVIGILFAVIMLITANALKTSELKRVALAAVILIAIAALPVYYSGEGAEESVERMPWASEQLVERHEEWAFAALVSAGVSGIFAMIVLMMMRSKSIPAWSLWGILVLTIITSGLFARTANTGGQIRHTEIRTGAGTAMDNNAEYSSDHKFRSSGRHDDDD